MAQLPHFDPADVATKSDIAAVETDIADVKTDIAAVKTDIAAVKAEIAELRSDVNTEIGGMRDGLAAVNQRLDRLFQTLLVGMFGVTAAFIGLIFRIG